VLVGTVAQGTCRLAEQQYHFKCESKVSNTYGPTRPVAGSTLTPPSTAASRIRGMSAGACYIGNLPSLPRDHMMSPTDSNGGGSSKLLQLFSTELFRTSVLVFLYNNHHVSENDSNSISRLYGYAKLLLHRALGSQVVSFRNELSAGHWI